MQPLSRKNMTQAWPANVPRAVRCSICALRSDQAAEQQAALVLHRTRHLYVRQMTAVIKDTRDDRIPSLVRLPFILARSSSRSASSTGG